MMRETVHLMSFRGQLHGAKIAATTLSRLAGCALHLLTRSQSRMAKEREMGKYPNTVVHSIDSCKADFRGRNQQAVSR